MAEGLDASFQDYKTLLVGSAEGFTNELSSKAHELLLLFDDQIIIDEVSPGKVESEKLETADLLRRRAAGQTLQRDVTPPLTARGRGTWAGLPTGDLVYRAQNGPEPPEPPATGAPGARSSSKIADTVIGVKGVISETLQTLKRTLGHEATVIARNKAYEEFKEFFLTTLVAIEDNQATTASESSRWNDSWAQSVTQIQLLYQETPLIQLIRPKTVEKEMASTPTTREGDEGDGDGDEAPHDD